MPLTFLSLMTSILQKIVFDYCDGKETWYQVRLLNQTCANSISSPFLCFRFTDTSKVINSLRYLNDSIFRQRIQRLVSSPRNQICLGFLYYPIIEDETETRFDHLGEMDTIALWGSDSLRSIEGIWVAKTVKLFFCQSIEDLTPLQRVETVLLDSVNVTDMKQLSHVQSLSLTRVNEFTLSDLSNVKKLTLYNIQVNLEELSTSVEFLSLRNYYQPLNMLPLMNRKVPLHLEIVNGFSLLQTERLLNSLNLTITSEKWMFEKHWELNYDSVLIREFYSTDCPMNNCDEVEQIILNVIRLQPTESLKYWLAAHPITPLQMMLIRSFQSSRENYSKEEKSALNSFIMEYSYLYDSEFEGWLCEHRDLVYTFPMTCLDIVQVTPYITMIAIEADARVICSDFLFNSGRVSVSITIEKMNEDKYRLLQTKVVPQGCFLCENICSDVFCASCENLIQSLYQQAISFL